MDFLYGHRQGRVAIGVNERDGGTICNTQLLFDADGALIQRRRKISPTFHERMIWGQMARACAPWTARSGVSANLLAGSITIPWRATH
jgi:predicted amidohydrolase